MRSPPLVLLLALAACGRVGFDARALDEDAGSAALGPFSTPVIMPGLETIAGDDPTLTGDLLEMVYEGSGQDLWVTRRASSLVPWQAPQQITELATAEAEGTPEMTYDGLTLYFSRGLDASRRVLRSVRASRTDAWGTPVALSSSLDFLWALTPSPDGDRWVVANDGGSIYVGEGDGVSWVLQRANELELDMVANGGFLATPTELWLAIGPSATGQTLYVARRSDPTSPFAVPERVVELDLAQDDVDPWLSPDRRTIVFVSRIGGSPRLHTATR